MLPEIFQHFGDSYRHLTDEILKRLDLGVLDETLVDRLQSQAILIVDLIEERRAPALSRIF